MFKIFSGKTQFVTSINERPKQSKTQRKISCDNFKDYKKLHRYMVCIIIIYNRYTYLWYLSILKISETDLFLTKKHYI